MKKIVVAFLFCFFIFDTLKAQDHELGFWGGGTNFIGDIGSATYLNPNDFGLGVVYKIFLTKQYHLRVGLNIFQLKASDNVSALSTRQERNLSFRSFFGEINTVLEFNFLNFKFKKSQKGWSPYFFLGISFLGYDSVDFSSQDVVTNKKIFTFAVPFGIGAKLKMSSNFILGAEIGPRYTFTDYLDGVNTRGDLGNNLEIRGDLHNNDWYVLSGIYITYVFDTCFCKKENYIKWN